ncbi:MAG: DUF1553 domain-containing protein [Verrucomicrobiae bacterium]|nr:DUF1553 domain-containing protein [Verrucomicrobiae bacterium]
MRNRSTMARVGAFVALILSVVWLGGLNSAGAAEKSGDKGYEEPGLSESDRRFWAFRPLMPSEPPVIRETAAATTVDAFLLDRFREIRIEDFAPEANPDTLLRRLSFTARGLPPTLEERRIFLARFARDPDKAWREEVDRQLDTPEYGERWAQHWLDVARFAETDGFEHDKVRGDAWRYRDWVVRAFNEDLSFQRFVALQIAGDELEPESSEAALATGFLLAGPDMPDINLEQERRHNVLNELTSAVGSAFLGLTMECAQCHDHRTDPISQADFYRLRAVFDDFALPPKSRSLPVSFPSKPTEVAKSFLYVRGDFRRPGVEVAPGFPRVLCDGSEDPREIFGDRRVALARWLTRPENPLTARVMANRIWQHDFGKPLVGTPSDFGKLGDRPTHPELLDWLAENLIKSGSMKSLHREILNSRAWRQASFHSDPNADKDWSERLAVDPDNALLTRQNRRRLDGEAIRDAMLLTAGRLNSKRGGPGVRPPLPEEITTTLLKDQWPVTKDSSEHDRRSLYLFARRNLRFPFFEVFDRPDANQSCPRRQVSTTAPQALTLWNDAFVHRIAADVSERLRNGNPETSGRVVAAYPLILGREATVEEIELLGSYLASHSLEDFCLAMFNLNEFVYLD